MKRCGLISAAIRACAVAWAGATACLAADVVVLRSGTMMEGQVLRLDADELVLSIESGKSILDRDDVRSIHFDTTIGELSRPVESPRERDASPEEKEDRDAGDEQRVFVPSDKKEFDLGDAVRAGSLRLRLAEASIRKVEVVDLLGGVNESRDPFLVLRFEVANVGDMRSLRVSGDPVFGEARVRVESGEGDRIRGKSFGAGSRVQGELQDGQTIGVGGEREDLRVFERPGEGVEEIVVRVDLARYGEKGELTWRIAGEGWD